MKKVISLHAPVIFLVTILHLSLIAGKCAAQAGHLDATFGFGGSVTTDVTYNMDKAASIALQPDGKIIVAGTSNAGTNNNFIVIRYKPDGALDNSFGTSGKVLTFAGTDPYNYVGKVLVQPDGKIVVTASYGSDNMVVLRFMPDGTPDASFGTGGKAPSPGICVRGKAALQPDGKILVCGSTTNYNFAVIRYKANGTPDSTFNGTGFVVHIDPGVQELCIDIKLQPDGKIVLGGYSQVPTAIGLHFKVMRLNEDGTPDAAFGTGGSCALQLGDDLISYGQSLALQPDGKIILAGYDYNMHASNKFNFAMLRLLTNGTPDPGFGTAGRVLTAVTDGDDFGYAISIQADGKILLAGQAGHMHNSDFALVRYNDNGNLDTSFNTTGHVLTDFGDGEHSPSDMIIQPDCKILLAGTTSGTLDPFDQTDFGLARYLPGIVLNVPFTAVNNAVRIYPNPVTDGAAIEYSLTNTETVNISITDMQGRKVATILDNVEQCQGMHTVPFKIPQQLSPGNYCIIVATPNGSVSMTITK